MEETIKKVKVTIDGKEIMAEEGSTILAAAQQNGMYIPTLCHHSALSSWGGCRICVVEVDGSPKLVASCVTPVRECMEVVTSNARIIESRRTILEFLFAERNHNCMFCPQSGDCELQKLAYELQMDHLTVSFTFKEFPTDISNEYMALDHNRCILCGRCIRACREIAGAYVLNYQNRGPHTLVGFDLNETREQSSCDKSGVCMQLCPTGAIYNRYRTHYAVKGHSKNWHIIESLCPQCGLLCPTIVTVQENSLLKIEGVLSGNNDRPDRGALCYKGRFEPFKCNGGNRLTRALVRKKDGSWEEEQWESAVSLVAERLGAISGKDGGEAVFGVASSTASNEELFMFRDLMKHGWGAGYIDTFDGNHLRTITKAWSELGGSVREASWQMIPESDLVIFVGGNAYRSQPVISSLLHRTIIEKGIPLTVIGSEDFMHPFTSYYLHTRAGDERLLVKALLDEAIASGKKTERIWDEDIEESIADRLNLKLLKLLSRVGLDGTGIKAFFKVLQGYMNSVNPIIIAGEGLTGYKDSSALKHCIDLALLKGLLSGNMLRLLILKPNGNSAGALRLGLSPTNQTKKGQFKTGLLLLGAEDRLNAPFLDSFGKLEFLAVITSHVDESLLAKAHVLIPQPLWTEADGTYTSLDGSKFEYKKRLLTPPEGMRDSWQTLSTLARKTKRRFDFNHWDSIRKQAEEEMSR